MTDHIVFDIQGSNQFCRHCGTAQKVVVPVSITKMVAGMEEFEQAHKACPAPLVLHTPPSPERTLPVPAEDLARWPGLADWLMHGEIGVSSLTLAAAITYAPIRDGSAGAPYDASDFRRCTGLLKAVPSLRAGLDSLATAVALGPGWKKILPNWAELERLANVEGDDAWHALTDRLRELSND